MPTASSLPEIMDLESWPSADVVASFGMQTLQDLLVCFKRLQCHDPKSKDLTSRISRLRQMLRLIAPMLSSSDPESVILAQGCLIESATGLKALSSILELVRESNAAEDPRQEGLSETDVQPYTLQSDTLDDLHAYRLPQSTHRLRRRQRYSYADPEESIALYDLTAESPSTFDTPGQGSALGNDDGNNAAQASQPSELSSAGSILDATTATNHTAEAAARARSVPPCYVLVSLLLIVIGASLAIGLYYSIARDRMGDGFTTAGWMTAAGTLILAAPMARHYPHCKCWESASDGAD
jgi:hypothetical protein